MMIECKRYFMMIKCKRIYMLNFGCNFAFTVTNTAIRPLHRHFKCLNPAKCFNVYERVEVVERNGNGPPPFPGSPLNLRTC